MFLNLRLTLIVPKEHTTVDEDEDMDKTSLSDAESDLRFTEEDYKTNCINLANILEDSE